MFNLNNIFERFSFEKNNRNFRVYNIIIFIVSLGLYYFNNHFLHDLNWFLMFYFNDFLAIVVLLSFLNIVYPYKLTNLWLIIIVTILAGSIFDIFDIISYFGSMLIYLTLLYIKEGKINTSF